MALEIWTYQDAVEHLLDVFDVDRTQSRNLRFARQAVSNTYRDLPNRKRWTYYDRQYILSTVPSQNTGTIQYQQTGGAVPYLVTLTGDVWPSWAQYGRLIIGNTHYDVATRISTTTLALRADSNPGVDQTAGTTFTLYRNTYPMPDNFRALDQIWDRPNQRPIPILTADMLHTSLQYFYSSPATPWQACIRNDGKYIGNMSIQFGPPPVVSRTYDIFYQAKGQDLTTENYSTGTVTSTAGSATVTGSGTAWTSALAGCLIRFSSSATVPTSSVGIRTGNVFNPATFQGIVKSVESATSLTLQDGALMATTGFAYTISDPLDLEATAMYTAFLKLSEAEFARLSKRQDRKVWEDDAQVALTLAMEADQRAPNELGEYGFTWYKRGTISTSM